MQSDRKVKKKLDEVSLPSSNYIVPVQREEWES
jgi:hypothetical protein